MLVNIIKRLFGKSLTLYRVDATIPKGLVSNLQFFDNKDDAKRYMGVDTTFRLWSIVVSKKNTKFLKKAYKGNILTYTGRL